MSACIAGVDGCKNGWIAALQLSDGSLCFRLYKSIQDLLGVKTLSRIAIDIPIGLPDRMLKGGRKAEQEARRLLGKYHSRVFSTPCRKVVYIENYEDARNTAHKYSDDSDNPVGISRQTFSICPKIRELDDLLCSSPQERKRIVECHPEVSFCLMNKSVPLVYSKKTRMGKEARRDLLATQGFIMNIPSSLREHDMYAREDDILDSLAALWTARQNTPRSFPNPPVYDSKGIPMTIWA